MPMLTLDGLFLFLRSLLRSRPPIQSDAKGARPEPLGQLDREGKEANAYDKMNALGLARMEVTVNFILDTVFLPWLRTSHVFRILLASCGKAMPGVST